ncbi:PREDICTED: polyadenylate-binding protein RBP45A [Camelina sativa]|uniref:Polyadenylate-binding protein RBP45A n=1 Tax=Camelina sativa TaxID=90675 RepID=A0ABM0ULX1_CAMSA|nr:PREDICTED: polyadenylate-binding protein RBP45A [Camelina sativa]
MHQPPSNAAGAGQQTGQQQLWMMMQQQQQQLQQQRQSAPALGQQQQYGAGSQNPEVKSLWIGDLQQWMDESYIMSIFGQSGEAVSAKVIRNKLTRQSEGYGFIEFVNRSVAERFLQTYNGAQMPSGEQTFRLNWAQAGAGERRQTEGADHTIFVGDLGPEVTDQMLTDTFKSVYVSIKGAKVVMDRTTGRSKGYGFVRFGDETEQMRAMTEMNGQCCSTRPMRIGPAANKNPLPMQPAMYQNTPGGNPGDSDPNNTTVFVGGLDTNVTDDELKSIFGQFGELIHVKIPPGKRCGFVQFANRASAEHALSVLNGTQLGGQSIRLSWGRTPNKQPDQAQWNGGGYYGGYPPQQQGGYEAYGYAPQPTQDPNAYYGGGYSGYGNYQQQRQ